VGVLTFIWREIARKDFLPSSINDFMIAISVSSRSRGKVLYYSIVTAITRFNYYEEEFEVAIA
jgi:hypothetical protein